MARLPRYCAITSAYWNQVDTYMKATYGNRTYKLVRNSLLRKLMATLVTGKAPSEELPDRKLASMLRKTERQLAKDGYGLPKAFYEKQVYSASPRTAASHWDIKPVEIKYLDELWATLGYTEREYRRLIRQSQSSWTFDVDEMHEEVAVWLDDKAIEDIVLVALEAYAVPRRGVTFTETYGMCFGSIKTTEENRPAHGKHTTRYVHVSSVHIQLRAEGFSNKVTYDLRSLETQMAVARHLFPQLDIVGDFHTHPYRTVEELRAVKGWRYSGSDESCVPAWAGNLRKMGFHPRASLIVAVATGGRRIHKPGRLRPNVIRFSINKYHFYIACYRIIGNSYSDRNITLYPIPLFGT